MTHEQFKKSIEKKELQLSFWGTFTHYGIVAFLLFIDPAQYYTAATCLVKLL
jgi:hypothetical protein